MSNTEIKKGQIWKRETNTGGTVEVLDYIESNNAVRYKYPGGYVTDCAERFKEEFEFVRNNESMPMSDPVNSPSHYTSGSIECIDAIKEALTEEEYRGYCKGNVMKYTWRERHKGGTESLRKAEWYLKQLVGEE